MINKKEYQLLTKLEPIAIKGDYNSKRIWLNGIELNPASSQVIYTHSENGFDWGHSEGGSAQLALAVLLDVTKNKKISMILHHAFKNDFILNLQKSNFEKTINIASWFYDNISKNYILQVR